MFLDFKTSVVHGQRQANALYFNLSNVFDLVQMNLLLHKFSSFGFTDGYFSPFRSSFTDRQFRVSFSGAPSLSIFSSNFRLGSWVFYFQRIP
jgi:hypothetical protein